MKIYENEVSGAKSRKERPAYSELCKTAFLKKSDPSIEWDGPKLRRSMKEFIHFLSEMDEKGIDVFTVKNGLDNRSSSGRMMIKLIGVLEEWKGEMLIDRTNAGVARTVANETILGR